MNPIEVHKAAVASANHQTFAQFKAHGPYEPGTPEHDLWLNAFDRFSEARDQ